MFSPSGGARGGGVSGELGAPVPVSSRRRDPLRVWLLSLLTGGVYGVQWWYLMGEELRDHLGRPDIDPVRDIVIGSLCCPYVAYLPFKYGAYIAEARARAGLPTSPGRRWAYVALTLLCMYGYATMQEDLNEVWREEEGDGYPDAH